MIAAKRYGPGEWATDVQPGDFILTHRKAFPSRMIAFGQALRFRGARKPFAHWSHAALVVSPTGGLVEALGNGVVRSNISKYDHVEYHVVHVANAGPIGNQLLIEQNVVRYAVTMADRHTRYGYVEILSLGLQLLTGARLALTTDGHMICSGLVATALERTSAIFPRNAGCMMPADLAEYYGVQP